jgi:pyruvate dehydrogenase E2 component (dihydrolipoamide acetyltransferase)
LQKGGELMAVEFFIPKLGQTVEEVTIIDWLVKDGERVEHGQSILEVETDKAVFPVEATASGVIHLGPYKKGDVVPVITTVALIGKPDDRFSVSTAETPGAVQSSAAETTAPAVETAAGTAVPAAWNVTPRKGQGLPPDTSTRLFASPRARKLASEKQVDLRQVSPTGGSGVRVIEKDVLDFLAHAPRLTPVARRVAEEAGVSVQGLSGSGPGGRITRADVEQAMQSEPAPTPAAALPVTEPDVIERIPLSGVRAIIAERMAMSVHTTARVTLVMEVDATQLVQMRERLKGRVEQEWGFAPGYNDLLAKMVATALRKFPYMNARLTEDSILHLKAINMGMATDTDRGLLVPVIRDADKKSLRQFGLEFRQLVEHARQRKSLPDDLSGGTFTITSLGAFGIDAFTPVINYPEAAILGVGRIAPRPTVVDGQLAVRTMCTLSLVFDHRLVDGAPAARFLAYLKEIIEEPTLWLSDLQE